MQRRLERKPSLPGIQTEVIELRFAVDRAVNSHDAGLIGPRLEGYSGVLLFSYCVEIVGIGIVFWSVCQDYERAEGNCALGIGAILDKNMDTMDDVFYS